MEKKYYIVIDNEQAGPYSIEELKDLKIKKDSLVWKEGLENWVVAESIEELKPLFIATPPPIPKAKESEVVIKTKEPLQFEDNLKKEKLEKQKIQSEITKKKTAKEIKRTMKFFKFSLLIGVLAYLISFGIYNGFKFLPYYFNCDYSSKAECEIHNIKSEKEFEVKDFDNYKKWSKLVGLEFNLESHYNSILNFTPYWTTGYFKTQVSNFERGYMYNDRTYQGRYDYNRSFYDFDLQVTAYNGFRYEDLEGNALEKPDFDFELSLDKKPQSYEYRKFESDVKKGKIKEIKIVSSIKKVLEYGSIIHRNVEYAAEYAFLWGIGFLGLVFPVAYLLSLLFIGVRNTKDWVEKNSKDN